ncbi:transglutaminase domain-containing protein [bacterium]|nr:transglutaminase domain-containing protein [bacterium]
MGDAILYLTSLGVTLSGLFAYYQVVESSIVRVTSLIFVLTGYFVSYLLKEKKNPKLYSSFFIFTLIFLLLIDTFKGKGLLLFPPEVGGEPGLIVGSFLLWLVVIRSYNLYSEGHLLFSIIPSLAFLGLVSAYSVDPELFLYTSLFSLFSILLLIFSAYGVQNLPSLRAQLLILGLIIFLLASPLALSLLVPLRALSVSVPIPQVYVRLGNLFRQDFFSNFPFLPNSLLVGSGLPRGDNIILELKGDGPVLLKAGTYDYFTGRYWVKTLFGFSTVSSQGGKFSLLPADPDIPKRKYHITLKEENPFLLPPLGFAGPFGFFGRRVNILSAPHPCELRFTSDVSPYFITIGMDYTLSAVFMQRGEISYEVLCQPEIPLQAGFISSIYYQKPLSPQTTELARKITAQQKDDLGKALAILNYLKTNYTYRLSGSPPPADNAVEWFLFKRKKGDCDFFASAMCILLREVGIPARVVVGYSVSEYDQERDVWLARARDAHMWVEAYIKGKGWMTFDPTPAGGSALDEFLISLQRYYSLNKRKIVPIGVFLISLVLLLLLYRLTWQDIRKERRRRTQKEELIISYFALCRKLSKLGLPSRQIHHTFREWLGKVSPFLTPSFSAQLAEVTKICEEVCYRREVEEGVILYTIEKIKELRRAKKWQIIKTSSS